MLLRPVIVTSGAWWFAPVRRYNVVIGYALRAICGSWVSEHLLRLPAARGLDGHPIATVKPAPLPLLEGHTASSQAMEVVRVNRTRGVGFLALTLALSGCGVPKEPVAITRDGRSADAAVVRRALPEAAPPAVASVSPALPPPAVAPTPPVAVPAGSIYVCVVENGGVRQQTSIEFSPSVGALCAKHPEMGPCQYERDMCRRSGGRVYAAGGVEITLQTESDYDKKVMRARFKSN